ncbi:MAG: acyl carrier protein, partial [Burkholderiales bacterium]
MPSGRRVGGDGIAEDDANGAQLLELLRGLARELHPQDPTIEHLGLGGSLERDYGLDSLARVELAARIEQALGVRLPEEGFSEAESARDLLRFVASAPHSHHG